VLWTPGPYGLAFHSSTGGHGHSAACWRCFRHQYSSHRHGTHTGV